MIHHSHSPWLPNGGKVKGNVLFMCATSRGFLCFLNSMALGFPLRVHGESFDVFAKKLKNNRKESDRFLSEQDECAGRQCASGARHHHRFLIHEEPMHGQRAGAAEGCRLQRSEQ